METRTLTKRSHAVKLASAAIVLASFAAAQDPPSRRAARRRRRCSPPPAGVIARATVDEKALAATVDELVACGTRHSLSSWDDPKRGIGCGRDRIVARFEAIAKSSGGRLQVVVDRFEATSPRTHEKPARLENVYAILPGTDPALAKTVFLVSGHFDSMPSNVMDPEADAPGADDDASGVAVSIECARLLAAGTYRATLLFAAVSGEEQGLLGGKRLLDYVREKGFTVGGFLDNDIVGADFAPGAPHRVRVFSGGGPDGVDSPSRDLARAVEESAGRDSVRLVFRLDRLGRGGDHRPFVEEGLPAVRFTEPLENYDHEHQTPRVEDGREYGDWAKFLNYAIPRQRRARQRRVPAETRAGSGRAGRGDDLGRSHAGREARLDRGRRCRAGGFRDPLAGDDRSPLVGLRCRRGRRRERPQGRFDRQPVLRGAVRGEERSAVDSRCRGPETSGAEEVGAFSRRNGASGTRSRARRRTPSRRRRTPRAPSRDAPRRQSRCAPTGRPSARTA